MLKLRQKGSPLPKSSRSTSVERVFLSGVSGLSSEIWVWEEVVLWLSACFGIEVPCKSQLLLDCAADFCFFLPSLVVLLLTATTSVLTTSESVKKLLFHMRECLEEFSGGYLC